MPQANYIDGKRVNEATVTKMLTYGSGAGIKESYGACKWSRSCKNFKVTLGNGLCMDCWDNGGRPKLKQGKRKFSERQTKDNAIIDKYLSRVKGDFYNK